jgi:hypothetical protein
MLVGPPPSGLILASSTFSPEHWSGDEHSTPFFLSSGVVLTHLTHASVTLLPFGTWGWRNLTLESNVLFHKSQQNVALWQKSWTESEHQYSGRYWQGEYKEINHVRLEALQQT